MPANEERYTVDGVPALEGREGHVGVFFNLYIKLGTILQNPDFVKEPLRIHYMITLLTSLVPDIEERNKIQEHRMELKNTIMEDYKKNKNIDKLTDSQLDYILIESSLQSVGYIQDYVDRMIGLADENKVGYVIGKDMTNVEDIPLEEIKPKEEDINENS